MKKIKGTIAIISFLIVCCQMVNANSQQRFVVALDGSGDFASIQEAVTACGAFPDETKEIFIKNGVYHEKVLIDSFHGNITVIGESREATILTYDDHAGQPGIGTFNSYTLKVLGDHVELRNLTIENAAGRVGQAVALHVEGDYFKVDNCSLLGNQDTLYAAGQKSRQIYTNSTIAGTTDFIFGAAIAVFRDCLIVSKKDSYITAASTPQGNEFGYVFVDCKLEADTGVTEVYLGRPWRDYAQTVFINCEMGEHIKPEGWHNWSKPNREKTTFYAEYNSSGPGAAPGDRVEWSHQLSKKQLKQYKLKNMFRSCSNWNPAD